MSTGLTVICILVVTVMFKALYDVLWKIMETNLEILVELRKVSRREDKNVRHNPTAKR